jgi:hypothetical protein
MNYIRSNNFQQCHMKFRILLILIFLAKSLLAQQKVQSKWEYFYRLENIDSLKQYSLEKISGELQYLEIGDTAVCMLIFPISIYKSFDDWTGCNVFNFVRGNDSLVTRYEARGKLIPERGIFKSKLSFIKRNVLDPVKFTYQDSIKEIIINNRNDTLFVNQKYFMKDKTFRIFQRFTGY